MEHWKKNRNYRSFHTDNGDIAYLINIDGRDYPVTAEVYRAYSQADRRERYMAEVESSETILSIEKMAEDKVQLDKYAIEKADSPEAILLNRKAKADHAAMLKAHLKISPNRVVTPVFFRAVK
jgi:hypothetical protein